MCEERKEADLRILCFNHATQATMCSKLAGDLGSGRMTGVDHIVKNSVDGVFTEDERQG